jgi:DNA modification methylase
LEAHFRHLNDLSRQAMLSGAPGKSYLHTGPCANVLREFPSESVDAVVTSPPYFGMTDYVRSQRLTYLWFDWPFDESRSQETGARYKRHRQTAYDEYMGELETSFSEIARVLKRGAVCGIVAGESPSRRGYLEDFKDLLADACGMKIESVRRRTVARQRALSSKDQQEEVILARRL